MCALETSSNHDMLVNAVYWIVFVVTLHCKCSNCFSPPFQNLLAANFIHDLDMESSDTAVVVQDQFG